MLKEASSLMGLLAMVIVVISVVGVFYREGYTQDSTTLGITETVRTAAIENADYSSRLDPGQLFIVKNQFEDDFKERIGTNKNVKLSEGVKYKFDYLDNENGATKAIKVAVIDGKRTYQATYKIDIADS